MQFFVVVVFKINLVVLYRGDWGMGGRGIRKNVYKCVLRFRHEAIRV